MYPTGTNSAHLWRAAEIGTRSSGISPALSLPSLVKPPDTITHDGSGLKPERGERTLKARTWATMSVVLALVLAACGTTDDGATDTTEAAETTTTVAETTTTVEETTTTTEAPMAAIGSAEHPIKVLFVPSVGADEIIAGGDLLAATLTEATGLEFDVSVGSSYAATIEEMCASPDDTMGFIPAQGYVLANQLCGVDIELKSIRFGYDVYWAQFLVARDSDIETIDDLAGKKWAYVDATSTSGFLVPSGVFAETGIEPGELFEAGGHTEAARAIYNGEAEFATTFYSPPIDSEQNNLWDGDPANADVPDDLVSECGLFVGSEGAFSEGDLVCGGVEVRDARRNIREEAPDVIQKVKIIALSDPIPNDGVAFGPDVADDLKATIVDALVTFATEDAEGFSTAFDAYSWSGIAPTNDAEFDSIRALLIALGYSLEDF